MSTDVEAFMSTDIDITVTQKRQVPDADRELAAWYVIKNEVPHCYFPANAAVQRNCALLRLPVTVD